MLSMKLSKDGSMQYELTVIDRKPFTRFDRANAKLIPKAAFSCYHLEDWKQIYSEEIEAITDKLMEVVQDFQPVNNLHFNTPLFRSLLAEWLYRNSDNKKKNFTPSPHVS